MVIPLISLAVITLLCGFGMRINYVIYDGKPAPSRQTQTTNETDYFSSQYPMNKEANYARRAILAVFLFVGFVVIVILAVIL